MEKKHKRIACECGCDQFWVSVTEKNPEEGICCRCRKTAWFIQGEVDQIMGKMQADEIGRLSNIINEKDAEIENLRAKITDRFPTMADFSSLQDEKDFLEERLSENQSLDRETKRLREAIQGALRIDVLWVPKVADEEHWEEARALHLMRQSFLEALKETT